MKKVYPLLFVLSSLVLSPTLFASHLIGGNIHWDCMNDGRYVFKMETYMECTGATWTYVPLSIQILGNPLPTNSHNQTVSYIPLRPDSLKWNLYQQGDNTPKCDFTNANANNLSCSNRDNGSTQIFYYQSDTITLKGTPPQSGWVFTYQSPCCISYRENLLLSGSNSISLKSTMFPYVTNQVVDSCYDNSPRFAELPRFLFCRGEEVNLDVSAQDADYDSISYSFDTTLIRYNQSYNYKAGYSYNNPTPDTIFDPGNIPSNLDPTKGRLRFKINNGFGVTNYQLSINANAYRSGIKIATINNERIIKVMDCPTINNTQSNSSPIVYIGSQQGDKEMHVTAGDLIQLPISVSDTDLVGSNLQFVQATFSSTQFASDFSDTIACLNPPCAVLKNQPPVFDTTFNNYVLRGLGAASTTFEWQTACNHIRSGDSANVYYFRLNAQDDYCLIPSHEYAYLKVVVEPLTASAIQSNNNTLSSIDTVDHYQWYDCVSDSIIVGANAQFYTPSQNGSYAVILQNGNCIDTSACFNMTTVGLNESNFQNNINFYPNPSSGLVNIELTQKQESLQIKVRNIHGQLVQEEQFVNQSNLQLQLNGKPGIYFIELVNAKGERANVKVVKR